MMGHFPLVEEIESLSRRERGEGLQFSPSPDGVGCSGPVEATAGTTRDTGRAAGRSWTAGRRAVPAATPPCDALRMSAVLLASAISWGLVAPVWAVDGEPIVGSEALIGTLIPITGDPIETRSVELRIEFHRNSARITEQAGAQLRELGVALTSDALRDSGLAVYGHTDTTGPADYNRQLSERRAQTVAAFLWEHFAIDDARLREVRGYGEERPRTDLPPGAAAQRRVEIVVIHERPQVLAEPSDTAGTDALSAKKHTVPQSGTSGTADFIVAPVADPDTGAPGSVEQLRPRENDATARRGYVIVE